MLQQMWMPSKEIWILKLPVIFLSLQATLISSNNFAESIYKQRREVRSKLQYATDSRALVPSGNYINVVFNYIKLFIKIKAR